MTRDPVDGVIIERLQVDGRRPYAELADELGLTEDEARQRTESLVADDVIQIVAVTDPLQLGYPRQAMLGLEVEPQVEGGVHAVGVSVAEIEEVIYLARTDGRLALLAEVIGTSDAHLLELVTRIRRLPGVTRVHTFLYHELVKESYDYGTLWVDP